MVINGAYCKLLELRRYPFGLLEDLSVLFYE